MEQTTLGEPTDLVPENQTNIGESWILQQVVPIAVPVVFGIIVVVGLFGNGLVVLVVTCNAQMRSTTNLLIINLAVADLLFIIFCVPFTATDYALKVWPFGDLWCRSVQYLVFVLVYASVYTLVLMSLDRFLAVVLPVMSMNVRTERNACLAIAATWLVIVVGCSPVAVSHGEVQHFVNSSHVSCMFLDSQLPQLAAIQQGFNYPAFQLTFFVTSYVLPLLVIVVLYVLLLRRLWRGVGPNGHTSSEGIKSKRRVTRLVVVVVVIFAVCWCPLQIVLLLRSLNLYPVNDASVLFQIVAHVQAYMNSCVNPILYAFLSENFRKAFRKVMRCAVESPRAAEQRRYRPERTEMRPLTATTRVQATAAVDSPQENCVDIL